MAHQLHQLYDGHSKVMADAESKEQARFMSELITELDGVSAWLDTNEHLPPAKFTELLDLHKVLLTQIDQMERGKNAAKKLFEYSRPNE